MRYWAGFWGFIIKAQISDHRSCGNSIFWFQKHSMRMCASLVVLLPLRDAHCRYYHRPTNTMPTVMQHRLLQHFHCIIILQNIHPYSTLLGTFFLQEILQGVLQDLKGVKGFQGRFGRLECSSHPKCYLKNHGKEGMISLVDNKVFRWFLGMRIQQENVEEQKSVKRPPLGNRCITMVLQVVASFRYHNFKINGTKIEDA